ncbi:MAG: phosphate ABC transporter permease PstA [Candidatus Thermoplasmatota archaeon]
MGDKASVEQGSEAAISLTRKISIGERAIVWLLFITASVAIVVSFAIVYTLLQGSAGFFLSPEVDILEFFTGNRWVPTGTDPSFGLLPLISGTVLVAGGALAIGMPIGIGAALYLSEFASPRVRAIAKPVVELLAGIPSIVYGFFALLVISPFFRENFGASYFNAISAIIVMAVMILPIVVSVSDDAMRAVPRHLREASLAMGATHWETSTKVVIPAASSGIIASGLLGLGRAIGETMVVTLVAGSVARLTFNPLEEVQTMTAYIAQTATGDLPPGVTVEAAFAMGLVLFAITYIVNMLAARVVRRIQSGASGKKGILARGLSRLSSWIGSVGSKIRGASKILSLKRRYFKENSGKVMTGGCLLFAFGFLIFLLYSVFEKGIFQLDLHFLSSAPSWRPDNAGIWPVILGSVYLMALTMMFAVPLGIGAAIYLNEFARDTWYTRFLRRIIQNLAGVPSIVFGLVGLAVFTRLFGFGPSLLAGSLTLAIMILPIIVVTTEEALKAVPQTFREAAWALGATKWQTVRHHVLPNALPGTITGSLLALSRAIGETAPILFIGSMFAKYAPTSIFDGFMALPYTIFYWTRHPKVAFHELAAATIIVLLVILLSMNAIAIFIRHRAEKRRNW